MQERNPRMLKNTAYYLANSLKFHEIRTDYVAPLTFVVLLALNVAGALAPVDGAPTQDFLMGNGISKVGDSLADLFTVFLALSFARSLVVSFYQRTYLAELRKFQPSFKEALTGTLAIMLNIVGFCAIWLSPYALGAVLFRIDSLVVFVSLAALALILPILVLYLMLVFGTCYILDKNMGPIRALKASIRLSAGHRMEILSIIFMFGLANLLVTFFVSTFAITRGFLIYAFVTCFFNTLFNLAWARLTSLMYVDLEYGWSN